MNNLAIRPQTYPTGIFDFSNFDKALESCKIIAESAFAGAYRGRPYDVMMVIQKGLELKLTPLQALQNISLINGRACVWGDAMLAICKASPEFEYMEETVDVETKTATCKVKRRNQPEHSASFSIEDAKRANLLGKSGPWTTYPRRMVQMRARGFALRDVFPDLLQGIISTEEAKDYPRTTQSIKDVEIIEVQD